MEQYQHIVIGIGSVIGISVGLLVWRRCRRPKSPLVNAPQLQPKPQPAQYYMMVRPTAPQFGTQV